MSIISGPRLIRSNYDVLQERLHLLRDELKAWNDRVVEHGTPNHPYEAEVADLNRMIEWADERLSQPDALEIVVNGI